MMSMVSYGGVWVVSGENVVSYMLALKGLLYIVRQFQYDVELL